MFEARSVISCFQDNILSERIVFGQVKAETGPGPGPWAGLRAAGPGQGSKLGSGPGPGPTPGKDQNPGLDPARDRHGTGPGPRPAPRAPQSLVRDPATRPDRSPGPFLGPARAWPI